MSLVCGDITLEHTVMMCAPGTGTFGRVLLVRLRGSSSHSTANCYALKVLRKTEIVRLRQVEHVNAERSHLNALTFSTLNVFLAPFKGGVGGR